MGIFSRTITFVVILIVLAFVGIMAGVQLVVQSLPPPVPYAPSANSMSVAPNNPSIYTSPDAEGEIVMDGSFAATTTALSPDTSLDKAINESISSPVAPKPNPNDITASAYIVGNVLTGKVYISSHPTGVFPVASMSKLMTAIVATGMFSATTTISITKPETDVPPDASNLQAGEMFALKDLLYPLLLASSNVAAEAIASSTGRLHFMDVMSNTAWEIGMPDTYFMDPSGLDPRNEASANDMFALARYLYTYRPDILAITRTPHMDMATTTDHESHIFDSTHPFVNDPRFIGGKTGRTPEAGETMLTILRINSQPIVFIVLHSAYGERANDTTKLIKKYEML